MLDEWLPALTREAGPGGVLGYWAGFRGDEFAGWWALNPDPDDERQAELGYRLRRDQWGQGLATEGALALLAHGFETAGLRADLGPDDGGQRRGRSA